MSRDFRLSLDDMREVRGHSAMTSGGAPDVVGRFARTILRAEGFVDRGIVFPRCPLFLWRARALFAERERAFRTSGGTRAPRGDVARRGAGGKNEWEPCFVLEGNGPSATGRRLSPRGETPPGFRGPFPEEVRSAGTFP